MIWRLGIRSGCEINRLRRRESMRLIKLDTLLRAVYTLGLPLILAQVTSAQSVLNFARATVNDRLNGGFAVTNPTSNYADVQFTLFGLDGNPVSSGLVNPVRYRVAPKGQISMLASDLFASSKIDGWVQVTSPTSNLAGSYFSGDFTTMLGVAESSPPLTTQVIPVIRDDQTTKTEIVILNPAATNSTVTLSLFNAGGEQSGTTLSQTISGHAALRLSSSAFTASPTSETLSARISANVPVAATAILNRSGSLMFVPGQRIDQSASMRIAAHFTAGNGFDPVLVLTNPNASPTTVTVTAFGETGAAVSAGRSFTVPGNGSISADTSTITRQPFVPTVNGWLGIESQNVPLNGILILDGNRALTSIPLQATALDRILYSQILQTSDISTGLFVVNTWPRAATLDISLVRNDGSTFAQKSIDLSSHSKISTRMRDIFPNADQTSGYVLIRSSLPVYTVGMAAANSGAFSSSIAPSRPPDSFAANATVAPPKITLIDPPAYVQTGTTLRLLTENLAGDATFLLGDQVLSPRQAPFGMFEIDLPTIEPGLVNLRVRGGGMESDPVTLRVAPSDNLFVQNISGQAFYQKIDVTDAGLDLNHPVMVPIRNARIEVLSRSSQSIVSVSQTDQSGHFDVPVSFDANLTVRVVSRLRTAGLRVADNTSLNAIYAISVDIDGRQPNPGVLLADTSRMSGAFNILEIVQRANETIRAADPSSDPPPLTIFWSTKNTRRTGNIAQGFVGTSFFSVANNTAYILGDRNDDSDEFDDSVIAHEYGHMIAAKFSRDDSPGGETHLGDVLDPRVAWSEGWANFFSAVVRNDAIWRDDSGPSGVNVYRFDLRDRIPAGDRPGYWSETSVGTLLWELYEGSDSTGNVRYPLSQIWTAFTDLRNDRFVYLPYFLEHFAAHYPAAIDALQAVAQLRSIDFRANVRPSVTMPFPRPMAGNAVTGYVDSVTPRRTNMMQSSHYWSFTTTGGAASIRMDITGLGPADNPNANDLDIFLMDMNGRLLDRSDRGLNGQSELISIRLPAGTYVVEVRGFYIKADTGNIVFNSGDYRLTVAVQ